MKRFFPLIFILFMLVNIAFAEDIPAKPIKIAIINKPGQYDNNSLNILDIYQNELINGLNKIKDIDVLERAQIQKVLKRFLLTFFEAELRLKKVQFCSQ